MQFEQGGVRLVSDGSGGVWIADMDMDQFRGQTPDDVVAAIGVLNAQSYGGFDTWVLASRAEVSQLFSAVESRADANLFDYTYSGFYGSGYEWGSWGLTSTPVNPEDPNDDRYYAPYLAQSRYWFEKDLGGGEWSYPQDDPNDIGAWVKTATQTATQQYPVPEPMTILLLGTGMAALASFKRRFWRT
jgi:hypothetical protein